MARTSARRYQNFFRPGNTLKDFFHCSKNFNHFHRGISRLRQLFVKLKRSYQLRWLTLDVLNHRLTSEICRSPSLAYQLSREWVLSWSNFQRSFFDSSLAFSQIFFSQLLVDCLMIEFTLTCTSIFRQKLKKSPNFFYFPEQLWFSWIRWHFYTQNDRRVHLWRSKSMANQHRDALTTFINLSHLCIGFECARFTCRNIGVVLARLRGYFLAQL